MTDERYKNYLFFDTECSDGSNICSFGYVLTDSNFEILHKEDIVINPEAEVFEYGRRPTADFKLGYKEFQLKKAPVFSEVYLYIKEIIEGEGQVVIGHSMESDAAFLTNACKKYDKPLLKFEALDIQKMYKCYSNNKTPRSLKFIAEELGVDNCEEEHTGISGAMETMEVFKKLQCKFGFEVCEAIKDCRYTVKIPKAKKTGLNFDGKSAPLQFSLGEQLKLLKKF